MTKLAVKDYGPKLRYLLGHRDSGVSARFQDVLNQLASSATLSRHQKWIQSLGQNVRRVEAYMVLCEAYADPDGDLNLSSLAGRSPKTRASTHSNWLTETNLGPREDYGVAAACLFGLGCPEDDPDLPYVERRMLWADSKHPLWRLWCDGTATEFVEGYREAVLCDTLWFPERLEQEMSKAASRAEVEPTSDRAPEPLTATAKNTQKRAYWRRPLIACALALLAASITIGALLWPRDHPSLPGATVWIECLPKGGEVTYQNAATPHKETCPDTGLLPVDGAQPGEVTHVQQGTLPVTFVQERLTQGRQALWRPSPSFAKVLTRRRVVSLALMCPTPKSWVRLQNHAWGMRQLDCSAPFAQITVLRPSEAFVTLEIASQSNEAPQTCRAFLPVSPEDNVLLDPNQACGGLPQLPDWSFPLRDLQMDIDLTTDRKTEVIWLADPLALGSSQMLQAALKWDLTEVLQRIEQASDLEGWDIAQAQDVLAASPTLFTRAAGDASEVVALARMSECASGFGRVALSLAPARNHANANAAIALPCQLIGPEVGFWIAKSPRD